MGDRDCIHIHELKHRKKGMGRAYKKQGIQKSARRNKTQFTTQANQTIQGLAQQARATSRRSCWPHIHDDHIHHHPDTNLNPGRDSQRRPPGPPSHRAAAARAMVLGASAGSARAECGVFRGGPSRAGPSRSHPAGTAGDSCACAARPFRSFSSSFPSLSGCPPSHHHLLLLLLSLLRIRISQRECKCPRTFERASGWRSRCTTAPAAAPAVGCRHRPRPRRI